LHGQWSERLLSIKAEIQVKQAVRLRVCFMDTVKESYDSYDVTPRNWNYAG
jgi:hypothetical protein